MGVEIGRTKLAARAEGKKDNNERPHAEDNKDSKSNVEYERARFMII